MKYNLLKNVCINDYAVDSALSTVRACHKIVPAVTGIW